MSALQLLKKPLEKIFGSENRYFCCKSVGFPTKTGYCQKKFKYAEKKDFSEENPKSENSPG